MFFVMIECTSEMSSVSFAMFRCVRVSMYSFFVFCMNVSAHISPVAFDEIWQITSNLLHCLGVWLDQ